MTIYIGNISYSMTEEQLKNLFSEFGNVTSAKIIVNKNSGRSKGFAFVDMDDSSAEDMAISQINGKEVQGRTLKISKANQKEDRDPQ